LEKGNIAAATQRLEMMATRLLSLGEAELSRAAMVEATRLLRTGMLSEEGKKKIHFGTRALTIIPDMMAPPPPGVAA
jgi:Ca-activated chloride channel family protein